MALWTGTTINSNDLSFVFNKIANKKAIAVCRRKNGLLYAILGKEESGSTPGVTGFQRLRSITGNKYEVRFLGSTATPTTLADANQSDAVDWANSTGGSLSNGAWGAAEFPISHWQHTFGVLDSELERLKGDELKGAAFIDEQMDRIMLSYDKVWGTQMSMANVADTTNMADASRTVLMSHVYILAGLNNLSNAADWANAGAAPFGTINRNDSSNADFRGNVYGAQGDLTLGKLLTAKNACIVNGGDPSVAFAGSTLYTKIEGLVSAYTQVSYADDWNKFGGAHTMYSGIRFVLDNYMSSSVVTLLDPTTWELVTNFESYVKPGGIMPDPSKRGLNVIQTSPWIQLICRAPNRNAVLGGLTS